MMEQVIEMIENVQPIIGMKMVSLLLVKMVKRPLT